VVIEVDGSHHYGRTRKADDEDRDRHWIRCWSLDNPDRPPARRRPCRIERPPARGPEPGPRRGPSLVGRLSRCQLVLHGFGVSGPRPASGPASPWPR
jgi:hypothetical protein